MKRISQVVPDEVEVGIVNGWRYVVSRSEGGTLFYVMRRSLSPSDHGCRSQFLTVRDTQKEAEDAARHHMASCERGVWVYHGD